MIIDGLIENDYDWWEEQQVKIGNVVYLYTFIGHGIPSKSGKFIYFVLRAAYALRPIKWKMAAHNPTIRKRKKCETGPQGILIN